MDYPRSVPGVGLVNGKFIDEDVVTGTPGSLIPAEWGNALTDELLAVIQAAQIEPNEGDLDQLLEAIRYIVQNDAYIKDRVYNKEEVDALLAPGNIDIAALTEKVQQLSVNGPVVGSIRKGVMNIPSSSATATYTADELVLETALGGQTYRLANFNKSINLATVGAGGMDTGAAPANGYVAIYAIYNPVSKTSALLATNAAARVGEIYSAGNMPVGYTSSCLLTVVPTNISSQFGFCAVRDRSVHVASAYAYITSTTLSSPAQVVVSNVPVNASMIGGILEVSCTAAGQLAISVTDGDISIGASGITHYVQAGGTGTAPFYDVFLNNQKQIAVFTGSTVTSGTSTYRIAVARYTI